MIFEQTTFTSSGAAVTTSSASTTGAGQFLLAPEGKGNIGSIFTHIDRQNKYSTGGYMTSSGPWTTMYGYSAYADNSLVQWINIALGDGFGASGTSQTYAMAESERESSRVVQFASGARLGHARDVFHYSNATGNSGHTIRILPIRNTSTGAITVNLAAYVSNYWSQGYEGVCLFALIPTGTTYSSAGVINSTLIAQNTSSSTYQLGLSGTVSIPGNKTVLICLVSTDYYFTTYRFADNNYFYDLATTFSNPNIICDMRMLASLCTSKFNLTYAGAANGTTLLSPIWTVTATNYGDR